jgi:CRP-like cAMP-binding protein
VHTNLVEFPAVAVGSARFRMQIMPQHSTEELVRVAGIVEDVVSEAKEQVEQMNLPARKTLQLPNLTGEFAFATQALPNLKDSDFTKIMKFAEVKSYQAGTTIFNQGESHGILLLIREGTIQIRAPHQGHKITIAECNPGEIIGEMSMLDGKGASTKVVAKSDVVLATLTHESMARQIQADPEFGMRFYQSLAVVLVGRLRKLNRHALPIESYG